MARQIPDFDGFPEPTTNFVRIPNDFFDKVMPQLTAYERSLLLDVARQTWGWQKRFECISTMQFAKRLSICKNTVLKGLKALERTHCILRYRTGRGSQQRFYYALNTSTNLQLLRALQEGHINIDQAELLNTTHPQLGARPAPTGGHQDGARDEPSYGSRRAPSAPEQLGAPNAPSQKTARKKHSKKAPPSRLPDPHPDDSDAAQHVREQAITRKRLRESASKQVARVVTWVEDLWPPKRKP